MRKLKTNQKEESNEWQATWKCHWKCPWQKEGEVSRSRHYSSNSNEIQQHGKKDKCKKHKHEEIKIGASNNTQEKMMTHKIIKRSNQANQASQ